MNHDPIFYAFCLLGCLQLTACWSNSEMTSNGSLSHTLAKDANGAIYLNSNASLPRMPFVYNALNKRDPFRSYFLDVHLDKTNSNERHFEEETEKYDIDQYHLTGLITGTSRPKAMIEDPTGKAHIIHIGSRIGKRGGSVKNISKDTLLIVEESLDITGHIERHFTKIQLHPQILQASDHNED